MTDRSKVMAQIQEYIPVLQVGEWNMRFRNLTSVKILIAENPNNYRRQMDNTGKRSGKIRRFMISLLLRGVRSLSLELEYNEHLGSKRAV
jgi:hypothetical protein